MFGKKLPMVALGAMLLQQASAFSVGPTLPMRAMAGRSVTGLRQSSVLRKGPEFGGKLRRGCASGLTGLKAQEVDYEARIAELGIELPDVAAAAANYVPYVVSGNYVYVAGQIPVLKGEIQFKGTVPTDKSQDEAYQSARLCGLNIIAQVKAACNGDLSKVKKIVKLVGFVNSESDFFDQPKVINGASDLMVEVFGDVGRHARSAVGVNVLPLGVTTEVEAIVEIELDSKFGPGFDSKGRPTTFQVGMKVEALDRMFNDVITVATIKEIRGTELLLAPDGWDSNYEYWISIDNGDFQPPGTCMRADARLSPPNNYMGFFDWGSYLEETNSIPAPPEIFRSKKVFPGFKGDTAIKFELWQRMEATVVPIIGPDAPSNR